jgi:hypothetical protein
MTDDILSSFLVKLVFKVDDPSKKHFDEAVASVEKRFAALGAAATAAAAGIGFAVKKISENLGELWYAAQAAQSSAKDMNAFAFAIEQAGGKAGEGAAELKTFTDYIKSTAGQGAFANWFKVPFDVAHPVNSLMVAIDQLSAQWAKGGAAQATAIQRAQLMGINPDELIPDRVAKMHKAFDAKLKETGWIDDLGKKSAALNADFNAITTHLKEMAEQAAGPLMNAMSGLLEKTDAWLVRNKDWLVAVGTTQAEGIVKGINTSWEEYERIMAGLTAIIDKITQVVGTATSGGFKALVTAFQALEPLAKQVGNAMHAALEWAMKPLQVIIDALRAMGLLGPAQASTGGSAGDLGGDTGGTAGRGFGAGEGTESGGRGFERRSKFGHGGARESIPDATTRADKNLNPGNIADSPWTRRQPGYAGSAGTDTGHGVAVFATAQAGWAAMAALARDKYGGGKITADQLIAGEGGWTPGNHEAAANVARSMGLGPHDDLRLNDPAMMRKFQIGMGTQEGAPRLVEQFNKSPAAKAPIADPLAALHPEGWRKALDAIRAKPAAPWQQSTNEHHDHRVVNSNVAVNVKGGFPVDKTERPLERPKLATLIRNTTAFAS